MKIYGFPVDEAGRCVHYHGETDIVSIKFKCCNRYYPCYKCHDESTEHERQLWPREEFNEKAILCGVCRHELTINEYLQHRNCPKCEAAFNPKCANHYDRYFEMT
ncbi:CHY zinc finger protein [Gracilibacillus sp. S3-1-1]|uniref:CHY zinc finger protein n=1 Tax=Gracilibacillus pellucidus TaxID=3095368 RepID=A0ACC6M662_9BACI|nr:CHY zinc finger protein [Gracilibacillus sp. S3-1-1]MDX8046461.1 CHY zinc finger protein [Gracilibacillus sp. S3-1-1]